MAGIATDSKGLRRRKIRRTLVNIGDAESGAAHVRRNPP
jgi:hypothetical protein